MALPVTVEWDVQSGVGNDNNGGGFNPARGGTDASQAAAPVQVYTDLVIQATNTNVASVARPFIASDVGNILNITGGTGTWNVARYEVVSVAAGIATLDRTVGSTGATAGAGRLGGTLASPVIAFTSMVNGNTVWLKGTFNDSNRNVTGGAFTAFRKIYGYGTIHGDNVQATLFYTSGALNAFYTFPDQFYILKNLTFNGNGCLQACNGLNLSYVENCYFTNASSCLQLTGYGNVIRRCWMHDSKTGGVGLTFGSNPSPRANMIEYCVITGNTIGVSDTDGIGTFRNCIIVNNLSHGVQHGAYGHFYDHCTVAYNGGSGFYFPSISSLNGESMKNCIIANNARYGIENANASSTESVWAQNAFIGNAFFNNALGNRDANTPAGSSDIFLSVSPFTNAGSGDYSLNGTAGGGASCYVTVLFTDGESIKDYCGALGGPAVVSGGSTTPGASIHEVQFPTDISRGSKGGPRWQTSVIRVASGNEKRIGQWSMPLYQWDVSMGARTPSQAITLVGFFLARKGRLYGFRFKDWNDYQVTAEAAILLTSTTFQIVKRYVDPISTYVRNIKKPVAGTVKVFNGGAQVLTGWTIDTTTGIVTFGSAPGYTPAITCDFDVPVRFDTDEMPLENVDFGERAWTGITVTELR